MRWISFLIGFLYSLICSAQVIENPVFDWCDEPAFCITKVKITKDTTYVFCSYYAEAGTWASISKNTYLRDCKSHKTFPLQRCEGFPYSPEARSFSQNESREVLFCFPSIGGAEQFDFVESETEKGFNIYGVNLKNSFPTYYTDTELKHLSEIISAEDTSFDLEMKKRLKYYATSLSNLVIHNASIGNHTEAIRLGIIEQGIREKVFGTNHPSYIKNLQNLVNYYLVLGIYDKAILMKTEVSEILKRTLGTNNMDYVESLSELALYNADNGNYYEAIRLGKEIVEIHKKISGVYTIHYATALSTLSVYYAYLGNYSEAIKIGEEALKIKKEVLGTDNYFYAQSVNNLAGFYSDIGDYTKAIKLGKEAVKIKKQVLGAEHPEYALSLRNLAGYYADLGDHVEALRLYNEVLNIRKRLLGIEHPDYARSLNDLAVAYYSIGKYDESLQLLEKATKIREKVLGKKHPDYAFSLNDLALCYARSGFYAEALKYGKEAMEIRKTVLGTEHPDYAGSLNDLADCFFRGGYYTEAEQLGTEAVKLRKKLLGSSHPTYARSLFNLSLYYYYHGDYVKAYDCITKYLDCSRSFILNQFSELSSYFQETLWKGYAYQFVSMLPCFVYKYTINESVSWLYDNSCLFAKGLLLNTGIEMRRLIFESHDSILIYKYKDLSTNISKYNKLIEKPINIHFVNVDSLKNVIQDQEIELARESKVFGDYTRNLTITWEDIQRKLDNDDIAIEYLDYPLIGTDSVMYIALTLKKEYECPHMITLCEANQLNSIPKDVYYTQTDLSNLVWKPLEDELKGVRDIYFAPSGELHKIGIEYLPISKTKNISDEYTLYRLSSTRQIAAIPDETKGKNNILYGGLDYDEKSDDISIDTASAKAPILRSAFSRANVDSLSLRSSFEFLEGTKKEADMIAKDMRLHNVPYVYYSGIDGTEESFKKLDGTRPKVMHIATHGFFLTEEEAGKSKFNRPEIELLTEGFQKVGRPVEDKSMTRSGLLFSGCNHAINHEQIPDGEEDGILTAQEISTLDLRGLDLAVLSACQTGLGDVISGEGVFGLQRGFKKAGAKTILMSLSKVDDDATRILMVEFYRNLMNGKTKHQSLKDAQKYLRQVDNGKYDEPKYWASFIMLDGLN